MFGNLAESHPSAWSSFSDTPWLHQVLPTTALAVLDLRANMIGDSGCIALASELATAHCSPLRLLNLHLNEVGDEAMKSLSAAVGSVGTETGSDLVVYGVRSEFAPPEEEEQAAAEEPEPEPKADGCS